MIKNLSQKGTSVKWRTALLLVLVVLIFGSSKGQDHDKQISLEVTPFIATFFVKNEASSRFKDVRGTGGGVRGMVGYPINERFLVQGGFGIGFMNFIQSTNETGTFSSSETIYEKQIIFRSYTIPLMATYKLTEYGRISAGFDLNLFEQLQANNTVVRTDGSFNPGVSLIQDDINPNFQFMPEFTIALSGGLLERVSIGMQAWFLLGRLDAGSSSVPGQRGVDEFEYSWIRLGGFLSFKIIK
jgi:opacity protein-like surface antigen